jgi:hypothetical protein
VHLHWLLKEEIEASDDSIAELDQSLKRIQAHLEPMGADLGVCNVASCMRLPGFYSHKRSPKLVELGGIFSYKWFSADELFLLDSPEKAVRYELGEILKDCPPLQPRPAVSPKSSLRKTHPADAKTKIERARKYLSKVPPGIQGMYGSKATFVAALKLLTVCGLTVPETADLMLREYNRRCSPPWPEGEIWRRVKDAARSAGIE